MVETTLDIRFSADGEACVLLDTNAEGDTEQQAELVCFGHYAATAIVLLGPDRAARLIESLTALNEATAVAGLDDGHVTVADPDRSFPSDKAIRARARFLNARGGPRISFAVKSRGLSAPDRASGDEHPSSVQVLFHSLVKRRAPDPRYVRRLASTARLIARLASERRITTDNQFDVSLAAADVAWRSDSAAGEVDDIDLECPACANRGSGAFEFRLWPSRRAAIRKCGRCGTGVWIRARRRARTVSSDVWRGMEAMRDELSGHTAEHEGPDVAESAVLGDLKRVFAENDWPFSEVRGAQVIVSELSGPLGSWKFYAQVVEDKDLILLFSVCPLRVPEERRAEVAQFLTRANYGLAAGNFELDLDDGEIRYKTALQIQGQDLDGATIRQLVRANGIAMETYLPGIGAVITGSAAVPALERRTS